MITIWKFNVSANGINGDYPPEGAKLLHVDSQRDGFCAWYECNTDRKRMTHSPLILVGTGWEVDLRYRHLKTFLVGGYVWHIYELIMQQ